MLQSAAVRGMATQSPPTGDQVLVKPGSIPAPEARESSPVANSTDIDGTEKKSLTDANPGPLHLNYNMVPASERVDDDGTGREQSRGADFQDDKEGDLVDEAREEEPLEARIERLGRQRPEQFKSLWHEIGFVFSISMSQVLSVTQGPKKLSVWKLIVAGIHGLGLHRRSPDCCC